MKNEPVKCLPSEADPRSRHLAGLFAIVGVVTLVLVGCGKSTGGGPTKTEAPPGHEQVNAPVQSNPTSGPASNSSASEPTVSSGGDEAGAPSGASAPVPKTRTVAEIKAAAEGGEANAQMELGMMYLEGRGFPRNVAAGREWFKRAAESGHPEGQFKLARLLRGDGINWYKANDECFGWMKKAAEAGHPGAQFLLAKMYTRPFFGTNQRADPDAALKWYRAAAAGGDSGAQLTLAQNCEQRDYVESLTWYLIASQNPLPDGEGNIHDQFAGARADSLSKKMLPDQLAEAQRKVEEFDAQVKKTVTAILNDWPRSPKQKKTP
jgi:Sel1 repeat